MTRDEDRRHAARQLFERLAIMTEHEDITKLEAFRRMCESTIAEYEGTENQAAADWAREAIRLIDEGES